MPHCSAGNCLRCDVERVIDQTKDVAAPGLPAIACVLSVLLGAMEEGSEAELAALVVTFSQRRLAAMDQPGRVN